LVHKLYQVCLVQKVRNINGKMINKFINIITGRKDNFGYMPDKKFNSLSISEQIEEVQRLDIHKTELDNKVVQAKIKLEHFK